MSQVKNLLLQGESATDSAVPPAIVASGMKKAPTSPTLDEQMLKEAKITLADKEAEDSTES